MKNLLLISLLSLLSLNAKSQQYGWEDISSNIPDFPFDTIYNASGDTIVALLTDVYFINNNEGWITTWHPNDDSAAILHTTDGGLTFDVQITMFSTNAIHMLNENEGYAGGNSGFVYRTIDGGEHWNLHGSIATTLTDISFPPMGETGYCCGINGNIWSIHSSGVTKMTSNINGDLYGISFPVNSEEGWVLGGSVIRHYASNAWNGDQDMPSGYYHAIFMLNNNVGWGAGTKIIHTEDGTNWFDQGVILTQTLLSVYFLNDQKGWTVGSGGTIFQTSNGGIDWNPEGNGLSTSILNGVHFTSPTNGYIVGNNKTLLKYTQVSGIADDGLVELAFEIYPNPCREKLTLLNLKLEPERSGARRSQTRDLRLEIVDISGRVVYEDEMGRMGEGEISVDVSHLPAGLYLVKMHKEGAVGVRKFIIQ